MTPIRLWSDIHLEYSKHNIYTVWNPDPKDQDQILILAGDFDVGILGENSVRILCDNFKHVLRVAGNHEFYGQDYERTVDQFLEFEQIAPSNYHFLHNDVRLIGNMTFIGGTMWTSFNNADPVVMNHATNAMNDYKTIYYRGKLITPDIILEQHTQFIEFLKNEIGKSWTNKVVITHHSPGSVFRSNRKISPLTHLYFSDLEMFIGYSDIRLWLHGHTHVSQDYRVGDTRIVCNPYGYHGVAINKSFNGNLVIDSL